MPTSDSVDKQSLGFLFSYSKLKSQCFWLFDKVSQANNVVL